MRSRWISSKHFPEMRPPADGSSPVATDQCRNRTCTTIRRRTCWCTTSEAGTNDDQARHLRSRVLSGPANRETPGLHRRSDQPPAPPRNPRCASPEMAAHDTRLHRSPLTSYSQRLTHHQESQQKSASGLPQPPTHSHALELTPRLHRAPQAPVLTRSPQPLRLRDGKPAAPSPGRLVGASQQVSALFLAASRPAEAAQEPAAAPRRTPSPHRIAPLSSSPHEPVRSPPGTVRSNSRT